MPDRVVVEELPDGRVAVALQRDGQLRPEAASDPVAFVSPLSESDLEDLRWYLEDYLAAPYAVYEERGQSVAAKLKTWGQALFAALFGPGRPGRDPYLQARAGQMELSIVSRTPRFMGLPWELIWDPQCTVPLALALGSLDRTLVSQAAAAPIPPGDVLRVLMVIARPAGIRDVGYQMIARPLMERLDAVRGKVQLDVLRPPTFDALQAKLRAAAREGVPYHILHFDGHGAFGSERSPNGYRYSGAATGYLAFEAPGGEAKWVPAETFALAVTQGKVPLVVLNACQSGMIGQTAVEAAVATRLLEGGAVSVVAMGYSVYAVAAAEFMAAFYESLFAGDSVSIAVAAGRRRLSLSKDRPSPKGLLPLEDWFVPVHYSRRDVRFDALRRNREANSLSLDTRLNQMRPSEAVTLEAVPAGDELAPFGRFVGRDAAFYALELALQWQRVVVVHGPAGTGKSELAKAFGRWWRDSGGVDRPDLVFFHSFESGAASLDLESMVTEIGLRWFGPDFFLRTADGNQRRQLVLDVLGEHRLLLIWDSFESVYSLADPSSASGALGEEERQRLRGFLEDLARSGGRSCVIITSRTPETWLGNVRRLPLGGLTVPEVAEMAEDLLRPYPNARLRRKDRASADLSEWLEGHPLSLRLILPHLEAVPARDLLRALKGETQDLPPGFVGEGRLDSLGASLKYSLDHLESEVRWRLPVLSLFERVTDMGVLACLSALPNVPARYTGVSLEWWISALRRLAEIGLLTELGLGMYALPPSLPAYLLAEWRQNAGAEFEKEKAAAARSLLIAYADFCRWLLKQILHGEAKRVFALIGLQHRLMSSLVGAALSETLYAEAEDLLQVLTRFWQFRGLVELEQYWVRRSLEAVEEDGCTPPDLASHAGSLWLFSRGNEANRALLVGDTKTAYDSYDSVRRHLDASNAQLNKSALSVTFHQLGVITQHEGHLDTARNWYLKALRINEADGNLQAMALSYHQLGTVAQGQGHLDEAEDWYLKALRIEEDLGNRPGAALTYHQLGTVSWQRRHFDTAEDWYWKALEINDELGNLPGIALAYHQLGAVAHRRGYLDVAKDWYLKALKIEVDFNNRSNMAIGYHQLGMVAIDRDQPDVAERWYLKELEIEEELGNRPGIASVYHQLGVVEQDRGKFNEAESWYRKSLLITTDLDDRPAMAATYHQLGMVEQDRNRLDEAESCYHKSLEIKEELGNQPEMGSDYHQLGRVEQQRHNLDSAEGWYQKALKIYENLGDEREMADSYNQLGLLAVDRRDLHVALDWMVRCVALFSDSPPSSTNPGPHNLARLTAALGMSELEASWKRYTGTTLPRHVRVMVERMTDERKGV